MQSHGGVARVLARAALQHAFSLLLQRALHVAQQACVWCCFNGELVLRSQQHHVLLARRCCH